MEAILECKALSKAFPGKGTSTYALDNVNLSLGKGDIVGLLGPNGSGKTTLIKLCTGLLRPTAGILRIAGMEVGPETKALVSYLPDHNFLTPWMTVTQMISYFQDFFQDFRINRAQEMLKSLHIDPSKKIKTLSKGTKEKVALILAMSREAQLYLLDEPIAGVDPATRDYILRTILTNYNEQGTVVISTHLIADVEQVLSQVLFLNQGHIALQDSVDNIRQREGKSVDQLFREVYKC